VFLSDGGPPNVAGPGKTFPSGLPDRRAWLVFTGTACGGERGREREERGGLRRKRREDRGREGGERKGRKVGTGPPIG